MLISHLSRLLAATGRQGTRAVAASIFLGLALPPLAAAAKPLLLPCIIVLLAISFMRTDMAQMRNSRHAGLLVIAMVWIMGILPTVLGFIVNRLLPPSDSGVMLALVMQAAAPPIMSTPAFATLLGIDATLSLAVMVLSLCVLPVTAPIMVSAFTDGALAIDGLALAVRLGLILLGTAGAGFIARAAFGGARLARWNDHLNGLNVLLLLVLAVAFMDGVTARFMAEPWLVLWVAGLAASVSACGLLITLFLFRWAERGQDLMLAYAAGNRNFGILVAAAGGVLPDTTWLYVAVAQFPVYLLPYLLRPLAARLTAKAKQD
ncbi:hypothetical protein ABLE91_13710 [Aquabacter sp. CN5-332]|uniref:hypothetical protein n=1 Tax=Aquabacter sp. CN5-332 TaxID=3156608 RepID=UPI0032B587BF